MWAWPIAVTRCAGVGSARRQQAREDGTGGSPGGAVAGVPGGAEPVELGEEPPGPGRVEPARVLGLEPAQRLEVPGQLPRLGVEHGESATDQAGVHGGHAQGAIVGGLVPGAADPHCGSVVRGCRVRLAHPVAARELDLDRDGFAGARGECERCG